MKKLLAVLLGVALIMGFAITQAEAGMPAESLRLGASAAGFTWQKMTVDAPGDPELSMSTICIGCGAGVTLGYCIDENLEAGLNLQLSRVSGEEFEVEMPVETEVQFAAYFDYNYEAADKLVVYPEVQLGYLINTVEDGDTLSGLVIGGGAGLKYFLLENGSLDFGLNFNYGMLKNKNGEEVDISGLQLLIKLGMSLYFGI